MSSKRKSGLQLITAGNQHYVQVVTRDANKLMKFLRGEGFQVGPPGPCDDVSETIPLMGKVDVGAVQTLLDRWS